MLFIYFNSIFQTLKDKKPVKLNFYQRHKDEESFIEHRNKWAAEYRKGHPEIKEYQKKYHKKYFQENKERLNEYRKELPDHTRNERVNRFKRKEREELGKNYIIQLLTRGGKFKREEITPKMISDRRKQIIKKRQLRG